MIEEEESQGNESKIFSVRIVSIDYYMSLPISLTVLSKEVPVIRIYGSTPAGQKSCVHVHRALPYLYVPCSEIPFQSNQGGIVVENAVSLALEKAMKLKGNAGSKRQHVHDCTVVRAKKFYGYHSTEELFIKIYLYYPHDVSRAASLLLGGGVFERSVQPYEAHIPFLLQFMVDYNLYGMDHMHLVKMKFRYPVPADDLFRRNSEHSIPDNVGFLSSEFQADATTGSGSCPPVWSSSTILDDWMWQCPSEPGYSSNYISQIVKRQSVCQLEGDTTIEDILNQQLKSYTSLSQTHSDVRMVQSLVPIWEEDFERTGVHHAETLTDPGKPLPRDVLRTLSDGIEYQDKLRELYCKAESTLLKLSEDVKPMVSSQCLLEERSPGRVGTQKSDGLGLKQPDETNTVQAMVSQHSSFDVIVSASCLSVKAADEMDFLSGTGGSNPKYAEPEDIALLKWLASSQAAEDINSDDELHRETILNPLVPTATIDKVLEKANTAYESESQQECQDILDSVVDVLHYDEQKGKAPSHTQDKAPEALSNTRIPQLDGSGDDHFSALTANSSEEGLEHVISKCHNVPGSPNLKTKRRSHKMQWGSLPLSEVRPTSVDIHSGSFSMSESGNCSGQTKDKTRVSSSFISTTHGNSDLSTNGEDNSCCDVMDSNTLQKCSIRDLMRKKRCIQVEASECQISAVGKVSKNKKNIILPRKLDFHLEQSDEQNMQDLEGSVFVHGQFSRQKELCENKVFSACCQAEKKDTISSLINSKDKDSGFATPSLKSHSASLTTSVLVAHSTCSKLSDDGDVFVDRTLKHTTTSCSSCSCSFQVKRRRMILEGECAGKFANDFEICAPLCNQMDTENPMSMSCTTNPQNGEDGSTAHLASTSQDFGATYGGLENNGRSGFVSLTFHKKPPIVNWKNVASEDTMRKLAQPNCSVVDDDSDNEGMPGLVVAVHDQSSEDVLPFFGPCEDLSKRKPGRDDFLQNSSLGIPTHYQNDGSVSYLLTPAISPPSVGSVLNWLTLKDIVKGDKSLIKEKVLKKPLLESSHNMDQQTNRNLNTEGDRISDVLASCSGEMNHVYMKESAKSSQDISQISGPSGQSKPTPLSQLGFKDPASIGAGQQLTLMSIEVQVDSRGELRPDPQHDAIDFIALAVQHDDSSSIDIHVLLRGESKACGRFVGGLYKLLVYPDEIELLDQFIKIIHVVDPDILMAWDVQGSSLGFLAERASCLGVTLVSKMSRTPSETKAVKRDQGLFDKGNTDSVSSNSLISDTSPRDNLIIEDEWGRTHASGVHVSGRIVLNVWRLVRGEVKLNLYTLEAVVDAVLRRKFPFIHWKILNKWFKSGPGQARFRCIDYVVDRAKLNHEIINQLDMINRTSELARVFGIDFFSVLSRGSQYRVESMLIRLAHTQNYVLISPGIQQVASQPAMECIPLVMEPESGFYSDPVIVLDFQSLYPSMIIAYNLCYSTCLGNVVPSKADTLGVSSYSQDLLILKDLKLQTLVTPNGVMYVSSEVRRGVLPRLLEEILSTRIMVKQSMKKLSASQQILHRILNARQLALKLIANVTYGYTAAGFSGRMPCAELADSIVQCGRRTLEHAISVVNNDDKWNARVIYGDTDSMFVLVKGQTRKTAFRIGNEIAATITALNPNPVTLKMEKVYQSCFLLTKKRYVGYSYESLDQANPIFDAKGIETVRRDTCAAVAKTMEKSLRMFFQHLDISKVKDFLQHQWSRILSGRVSIQDFIFAKEVRLGTYSTKTASLPPAAIVASKAMTADPRAEPRYAERVQYVVVHGEPGARLVDMVVDPLELLALDSPYRLNDVYYITKQIIPALQRVFGLLGCDLNQWFQEMPRQVRDAPTKHYFSRANSFRARIDHYYSSKHCILCGELVQGASRLCKNCVKNGPFTAAAITGRTTKLERDIQHLVALCRHCGGGDWVVESGVKCTSLACGVYFERVKVQKELRAFSTIATEAGFYPKCVVEWF